MTKKELEKELIEHKNLVYQLSKEVSEFKAIPSPLRIEPSTGDRPYCGVKETLELIVEQQRKEEFEVGVWYKNNGMPLSMVCYTGDDRGCGVWSGSCWTDSWTIDDVNNWTKATPQEIETALISEAKKREFKEGVLVNSVFDGAKNRIESNEYEFRLKDGNRKNVLFLNGTAIFADGKWATIIEDSFEIAGHKVEIDGDDIKIGCQTFSKEALIDLYDACIRCNIDNIEHCQYDEDINMFDLKELIDYINK